MKLADFFIGSRQLFGFLAPGALWLFALSIPVASQPLDQVIRQAGPLDTLVFLALALVTGTAVESLSFSTAVRLSAALWHERVSCESNDRDYFPLAVPPGLIERCRALAVQHVAPDFIQAMTDREFSQYCKYTVLEHSDRYRARIVEYEAEINLLAMLPLPLVFFALNSALWGLGGPAPDARLFGEHLFVPLAALLMATLLLLRLHPLRREEAEWWFRFFLMTVGGSEGKQPASLPLAATDAALVPPRQQAEASGRSSASPSPSTPQVAPRDS